MMVFRSAPHTAESGLTSRPQKDGFFYLGPFGKDVRMFFPGSLLWQSVTEAGSVPSKNAQTGFSQKSACLSQHSGRQRSRGNGGSNGFRTNMPARCADYLSFAVLVSIRPLRGSSS